MRISKRLREQAAMICQVAASNEWNRQGPDWFPYGPEPDDETTEGRLAHAADARARLVLADSHEEDWGSTHWAEAEALLRTGWTPEGWE